MSNGNHPSLLSRVELAPRDPILGITEAFNADKNPRKVNLGVGIYYGADGKVPLLECVREAERQLADAKMPRAYLPIDGIANYDLAVRELAFSPWPTPDLRNRIVTIQSLGGTGGLRVGADFLRRLSPNATVWISDPSWENHRALFEGVGFKVQSYPYYDSKTHGIDFDGMTRALQRIPAGDIVVLHACCHNPTGVDLTASQWTEVLAIISQNKLIPFLDMAYQGFGDGLESDAAAVRLFAAAMNPVFVSTSFSKSFSLYGERVGALSVVTDSTDEAARVLSQLKRVIRTNYSNPPTHGGQVVSTVLTSPKLRAMWEQELSEMRNRIKAMRNSLAQKISSRLSGKNFDFVVSQRGMFSYSGLSKDQVAELRDRFGIYAVESGRICVAALNDGNIDYVAEAIAAVSQ